MRSFMRKYVSNRGSALFMVISTMTALMISCMAMYFSVISSRSTQYAIFNQQQSKQVSMSINDAVLAGMMDGQLQYLFDDMAKLNVGEKLTTNANGFAEYGGDKAPDDNLGAYRMEITRLEDSDEGGYVFDIVVTSSVNGANSIFHTIIEYSPGGGSPSAPTQIWAATGYVPNDVFLDGGRFMSDLFFDNEKTIINAYGHKNMQVCGDLSSAGSILLYEYLFACPDRVSTWAVRGDYTSKFNKPVYFAPGDPGEAADPSKHLYNSAMVGCDRSTVLIGGNAYFDRYNTTTDFQNANVYIFGDVHITGLLSSNSNYFVDGNVYIEGGNVATDMKNVYCNGIIDATKNQNEALKNCPNINTQASPKILTGKSVKSWNQMAAESDEFLSVSDALNLLLEKTASHDYYKWEVNDSNSRGDKYVAELDEKCPGGNHNESNLSCKAVHKTINFCQNYIQPVPTYTLTYSASEKGCIIDDITCDQGNTSFNHIALIIDTGEDPDNVYTIRVKANRDLDGDGKNETFMWYPFNRFNSGTYMNVLVKGRGSVVVDIPKGVTYQDTDFVRFMHYGWFVLGGGTEKDRQFDYTMYDPDKPNDWGGMGVWESRSEIHHLYGDTYDNFYTKTMDFTFESFVHRDCTEGDGCAYTEKSSSAVCPICGGAMKSVVCSVHEQLSDFCPACSPEKNNNHAGECKDRVGRKEIDNYLATHSAMKERMEDSKGKIIYPTTNIYLVSCDESADIRLSTYADGTKIKQNSFFGYVYAPYMTFKAYGENSGGNLVRMMGGMTVSSYIIDDSMTMISCWPEKMPQDLMSSDGMSSLPSLGSKSWKITPKAH